MCTLVYFLTLSVRPTFVEISHDYRIFFAIFANRPRISRIFNGPPGSARPGPFVRSRRRVSFRRTNPPCARDFRGRPPRPRGRVACARAASDINRASANRIRVVRVQSYANTRRVCGIIRVRFYEHLSNPNRLLHSHTHAHARTRTNTHAGSDRPRPPGCYCVRAVYATRSECPCFRPDRFLFIGFRNLSINFSNKVPSKAIFRQKL